MYRGEGVLAATGEWPAEQQQAKVPYDVDTVIISDVHLGKSSAQAAPLLEFLQNTKPKRLILAGDIIDFWELFVKKPWQLEENQLRLFDEINRKMHEDGAEIVYTPGNHDHPLKRKDIIGKEFFGIQFMREYEFISPAGQKIHVSHGDEFDNLTIRVGGRCAHRLAHILGVMDKYDDGRKDKYHRKRQEELAAFEKECANRLRNLKRSEGRITRAVAKHAGGRDYDIKVIGHLHDVKTLENINLCGRRIKYCNTGDWVDSGTAQVIHHDGRTEEIHWHEKREELKAQNRLAAVNTECLKPYRRDTRKMLRALQRIAPYNQRARILDKISDRLDRIRTNAALIDGHRKIAAALTNARERAALLENPDFMGMIGALRERHIEKAEKHRRIYLNKTFGMFAEYLEADAKGAQKKAVSARVHAERWESHSELARSLRRVSPDIEEADAGSLKRVFQQEAQRLESKNHRLNRETDKFRAKVRPWQEDVPQDIPA